ncbi:MAG TPA: SGNH/GDSL hydrolase family protein [Trebonia sp.]|jgi:lysophospholipase L1-like esterase|nr:SGNH/GDSL hydrolase family protein [Trebonia sp.]
MNDLDPRLASFVALGDSYTEGMNDVGPGGELLGWADRLAEILAERDPSCRYANLGVRGKLLREIVSEQVPAAISLLKGEPGLVSIAGGGNDLLRPSGDPDALAVHFDAAVARLRQTGSRVLVFTGFDPLAFRLIGLLRGKVAAYNMHLRAIADARGCDLVDLWGMRSLTEPSAWSSDRLHLNSESHAAIALQAAVVLGAVPSPGAGGHGAGGHWASDQAAGGDGGPADAQALSHAALAPIVWARPVDPARRTTPASWLAARRGDYQWARESFVPWVGRRLRGTSSGDGRGAKRPELLPVRLDDTTPE